MKSGSLVFFTAVFGLGITMVCSGQQRLIVKNSSQHIEVPAIEHMLVEHPNGVLFS